MRDSGSKKKACNMHEDFFEAYVWGLHVDSQYVEAALKKKEEKKKDAK